MAVTVKRSLYQCRYALVKGDRIVCAKGHALGSAPDGTLSINRLIRGDPLELTACQECWDYRKMGPPLPPEERGWV